MPLKDIFHHKKDKEKSEKRLTLGGLHLSRRPTIDGSNSSMSSSSSNKNGGMLHQSKSSTSMSTAAESCAESSAQPAKTRKHSESISLGNIKPLSNATRNQSSTFDFVNHKSANTNHYGAITHSPGLINKMTKRTNTHDGVSGAPANTLNVPSPQKPVPKPLPSIDKAPIIKKKPAIVYNPYGVTSGTNYSSTSHYGNTYYGSTTNHSVVNTNSSAYTEEKLDLLPLPVEVPNDYLPEQLKQDFVDLYPTFALPDADSSKNKKLGDGASASVRTIIRKSDKRVFALKKFTLFRNETPHDFYTRCVKEFIIAKSLSSYPHIVGTLALVRVPSISTLQRGWGFILEYCKGGDLFSLIQKSGWKSTSNEEKFCIFKQVALGVKFIHDNDIVHRDLKPENVLLTERGVVKLTDFGVSTDGHESPGDFTSPVKLSTSFVGSPPYSPPEVMYFRSWNKKLKDDPNLPRYDPFKMDYWGLGMLLFCMVYQGTPFMEAATSDSRYREYLTAYEQFTTRNPSFKKEKIKGPGVEYKYGQGFKDGGASRVAWRLCDPNPRTRYTLHDLFEDKWFLNLEMCQKEYDEECLVDKMASHKCTTTSLFLDRNNAVDLTQIELDNHNVGGKSPENGTPEPKRSMLDVGSASDSTPEPTPINSQVPHSLGSSSASLSMINNSVDLPPVAEEASEDSAQVNGEDQQKPQIDTEASMESMKKEMDKITHPAADDESFNKLLEKSMKETVMVNHSLEENYKQRQHNLHNASNGSGKETYGSPLSVDQQHDENTEKLAGTKFFLNDLPFDKYCKGAIKKHHHSEVSDITVNALGGGAGVAAGKRLYSRA